jgi:hypothetical protein
MYGPMHTSKEEILLDEKRSRRKKAASLGAGRTSKKEISFVTTRAQ